MYKLQTSSIYVHTCSSVNFAHPRITTENREKINQKVRPEHLLNSIQQLLDSHLSKTEWWDAGMFMCLDQDADLHMAQLMLLPLIDSCSSKSRWVSPS